jgi:hypothetical protein
VRAGWNWIVVLEPMRAARFVGKLAELVPRSRLNLVGSLGCLALYASLRAYVVKDGHGPPPSKAEITAMAAARAALPVWSSAALGCAPQRERGLRWAELMRRVFSIDVLLSGKSGGRMKPFAKIPDKRVARRMLEHVGLTSDAPEPWPVRGPPESGSSSRCFDDGPQARTTPPQQPTCSRSRGAREDAPGMQRV